MSDNDTALYVSFAGPKGKEVLRSHGTTKDPYVLSGASTAASTDRVKVRAGFNRFDRDVHRPEDTLPSTHAEIILACQAIYRRIGLVRNIVDLMADFAAEGLDFMHPVRSQQNFFRTWANRVNLAERAHDFMRYMLRDGNVIVRRKFAKIVPEAVKQFTRGDEDFQEVPDRILKDKKKKADRVIPWRYVFLSPTIVDRIGGEVSKFFGDDRVGIRIPHKLAQAIQTPKTDRDKELVSKLPPEIRRAAKNRNQLIPLSPEHTFVSCYKKDDWEAWGTPFLYSVLDDIMLKDKMRQADIAALDGVINVIRLWKLGKSDKQILPTKAAVNKLLTLLQNNVGGGVMDLVWDDMIDLQVEYPPTDKILGEKKYESVNSDITRGLGVPDSLLGGSELSTRNAQTAFVQLKTLTQRLEYVRSKALEWINAELRLVADAMGFRTLPTVIFGTMSLRDEAAEKALVIQLLDRGIISVETVHRAFGYDYLIELEHLRDEQAIRDTETPLIERAGPYYRPKSVLDAQTESQIKLQQHKADTTNSGGDNPLGDQPRNDYTPSGPGRPSNQPSTNPRDERTPKVLSTVYETIAGDFLSRIDAILVPAFLESHGLKNLRKATALQQTELEQLRWACLASLTPRDKVTQDILAHQLETADNRRLAALDRLLEAMYQEFLRMIKRKPSVQERRHLMASAWSTFHVNTGGL